MKIWLARVLWDTKLISKSLLFWKWFLNPWGTCDWILKIKNHIFVSLELGIIFLIQNIKTHFYSHIFENHFRGSQSCKPFSSHISYKSFLCFSILWNILVCYKHYISCWWLRNAHVIHVSSRRIDTYACFSSIQDPKSSKKVYLLQCDVHSDSHRYDKRVFLTPKSLSLGMDI